MPRETTTVPDELAQLIRGAVEAGIFQNKSDAVREALREYFKSNRNARVAATVALYERKEITLGQAAQLAGVNRFEMRDILRDHGVELRLGPEDMEDAEDEIETALDLE
ncbi:MAG: UPF0175 family protein [Halobacteria archaeon]|nr:UPF0175 family protein [Halobacteria archaeon]